MASGTGFLNVDLEIGAKRKPAALLEALGARLHGLWVGRFKGLYRASYELPHVKVLDPTETILELVQIVKKLTGPAKKEWAAAALRDFNVGIQSAAEPYTFEYAVEPRAVARVAEVGGQIGITVYAPLPKPSPRRRAAR